MKQMRGGMVGARGAAALTVDAQLHRLAKLEFAARHLHDVDMQSAQLLLGVDDLAFAAMAREDRAPVADLPAGFAIERRLVGEDAHRLARLCAVHTRTVLDDGDDRAFGLFGVVAEEFGGAQFLAQLEP